MGINFNYINLPENSVNVDLFLAETKVIKERCVCGSGFWPGKWLHESPIFTDKFRDWLDSYNCKIFKAEAFRVFPNTALAWHTDTNDHPEANDLDLNHNTKINFMWGDLKNCFMEYGELVDETGVRTVTNRRGRKALVYNPKKMKVIERFHLENPVLINRGPAHRVSNESNEDWVCLSCIIHSKETGNPVPFKDALEIFKSALMK